MLVLAIGFAALIVSTGVYVSEVVSDSVTGEFDAALLTKAQALVQLTEDDGGTIQVDYTPKHMPEFERSERPEYFQFWLADGNMLHRSKGLRSANEDLPHSEFLPKDPVIRDVRLPDGRAGRMVELAFEPDIDDDDDDDDASPLCRRGKPSSR